MSKSISRIVVTAEDGDRSVEFHPPRTMEEITEGALGEMIGDIMAFPIGYHMMQQKLGSDTIETNLKFDSSSAQGIFFDSPIAMGGISDNAPCGVAPIAGSGDGAPPLPSADD